MYNENSKRIVARNIAGVFKKWGILLRYNWDIVEAHCGSWDVGIVNMSVYVNKV